MLKNKSNFVVLIILALFLAACGNQANKSEEEMMNEAKALMDSQKYQEAIDAYRALINAYPKSPNAINAYNQIAGIYFEHLKDYEKSVATYRELASSFPDTKEAKQSLFMVAFIYDETVKDKQKAIDAYKQFLAKYPQDKDPNDKMSESAKIMLQSLESGKSIEEMIESQLNTAGDQLKTDTTVKKEERVKNPAQDHQEPPKITPETKEGDKK